jgi:hypothetical protein
MEASALGRPTGSAGGDGDTGRLDDETQESFGDELSKNVLLLLHGSSAVSIVFCTALIIFAGTHGEEDEAYSLLALGLYAFCEAFTSGILMWRFSQAQGCVKFGKERAVKAKLCERNVNVLVGIVLLIASAVFFMRAFMKLQFWVHDAAHAVLDEDAAHVAKVLAWPTIILYSLIAPIRCYLSRVLDSGFIQDGAVTAIVALLFAGVVGSVDIAEHWYSYSWRAEPIAALVLAMVLFCAGMRVIVMNMGEVSEEEAQKILGRI